MVTNGNLTLGDKQKVQYTNDVLLNCTLETYIILLTDVTPINLIKKNKVTLKLILLRESLSRVLLKSYISR